MGSLVFTNGLNSLNKSPSFLCSYSALALSGHLTYINALGFPTTIFFDKGLFFKIIYLFSERGEGREKERESNISVWLPLACPQLGIWLTTQACALTRNRTVNLLVHRLALNPLSQTSQGPTTFAIYIFILVLRMRKWRHRESK